MKELVSKEYHLYLEYLRELTKRPSVFTNLVDVKPAIEYCSVDFSIAGRTGSDDNFQHKSIPGVFLAGI